MHYKSTIKYCLARYGLYDLSSYSLSWAGKEDSILLSNTNTSPTLTPIKSQSKNFDSTKNILVKGDNLEAMKALLKKYRSKIKMIYIDPPYNTQANNFIYKNNFDKSHSDWLSFIYPRLVLAHQLLNDAGVIFISIDDYECANLRLIMNEIFGNKNFIVKFIWRKKEGGGQNTKRVIIEHEYILAYSKSCEFVWKHKYQPLDKSKFIRQDKFGAFNIVKLNKWGHNAKSAGKSTMYYPIRDPDGNLYYPIAPDKSPGKWRFSKKTLEGLIKNHLIYWKKSKGKWTPYEKKYYTDNGYKTLKTRSILYNMSNTADAANTLTKLFGIKDVFSNPKPVKLLKFFISHTVNKGDIIMDFFAGSGTLMHAAMEFNMDTSYNIGTIIIQRPEPIHKCSTSEISSSFLDEIDKPHNVFEICAERIRRAGNAINQLNPSVDTGFKVFETRNATCHISR